MGIYIIGVTGASGAVYARSIARRLLAGGHTVHATVTRAGRTVLREELGLALPELCDEAAMAAALAAAFGPEQAAGKLVYHFIENDGAVIASGSAAANGMVVVPCSMAGVSALATGASRNLLERAADVMLKERRRLVLVPREVPLSAIHLQNMLTLSQCGAIVAPASPSFYGHPAGLDELVEQYAERILALLGAIKQVEHPWEGI